MASAREIKNLMQDYHGDSSSLSKTSLSMLLERPSTYWKHYKAPPESRESFSESKCLREGEAVHCLVLEPESWPCRYYVVDTSSRATKAFKEAAAYNLDKIVLTITEHEKIKAMADAVLADPTARAYLAKPGKAETSFYWAEEGGIALKCRPDFITDDSVFCVDLKTTKDISSKAFSFDAHQYKYHLSAAMTLNGVEAVRGIRPKAYIFICVENRGQKKPDVATYYSGPEGLELGGYQLDAALERYTECQADGLWPAASAMTEALELPFQAKRLLEAYRQTNTHMEVRDAS